MPSDTIFTILLNDLQVPHTEAYSRNRFLKMPFQSLFGLQNLLTDYGIKSQGLKFDKKENIAQLQPPFILETTDRGYGVARQINDDILTIDTGDNRFEIAKNQLPQAVTGIVLCAYPSESSCEPDYRLHRIQQVGNAVKPWLLAAAILFIVIYCFFANGLYRNWSTSLLTLIDMVGLYLSYLLILKQRRIHSDMAERVCGVLEKEGCSKVLSTGASSFLGLIHWSEVGAAYFGISLVTLLLLPHLWPALAAINLCCLPFTFWSIWYQRTRAKAWCTLCVSVQCLLWLQFFCYLFGQLLCRAWPLSPDILPLGAAYLAVLLTLDRLLPDVDKDDDITE